jgi:cytidine deaminase
MTGHEHMSDDELAAYAAEVLNPRRLSRNAGAGGVAAAILTADGNVYRGVCIDATSGMGFCAEHSAAAAMITAGEALIERVVVVWADERGRVWRVPPCGRCREFLNQLDERNIEASVLLEGGRVSLDALLPHSGWPTTDDEAAN